MQSGIYVGLSGQLALHKRLETVAHNVANVSTPGFRSEEVKFDTYLSRVPPNPVAFAETGGTYLSRQAGGLIRTDNPFDIAVQGNAWLSIDQNGQQVYTRDGRMTMGANGDLQTLNGDSILDAGGAAIVLNPNDGAPQIARDGAIFQNGQRVGAIGLFEIEDGAKLSRAGSSGVVPDRPAIPALDFAAVGIHQGFIEQSNVNPVLEMTQLIEIHRKFEALTNSLETADETLKRTISELGPTG